MNRGLSEPESKLEIKAYVLVGCYWQGIALNEKETNCKVKSEQHKCE